MASLARSKRWEIVPYDPQVSQAIEDACGVTPLVARIMAGRGISTVKQAREFLTPSLERDWGDALEIPGLPEVADRVERALRSGEQIAVFGDFDVDGISATCLLSLALRELGGSSRAGSTRDTAFLPPPSSACSRSWTLTSS